MDMDKPPALIAEALIEARGERVEWKEAGVRLVGKLVSASPLGDVAVLRIGEVYYRDPITGDWSLVPHTKTVDMLVNLSILDDGSNNRIILPVTTPGISQVMVTGKTFNWMYFVHH